MKKFSIKYAHIILLIVGIAFNAIGIWHSQIWFDESYSVGIAAHSFKEIWTIGGNDVHPILYYWILHVIGLVTNNSILAYRIFSWICISILGLLGFTHIRKDFGEKTGFFFSFFAYFLPISVLFAGEIRMYSLAVVLVTILGIYGYRLFKGDTSWKNWLIFFITSLACIYTHYYGLMAAGIINMIMLANFIKRNRKESIVRIIAFGILQLLCYVPWLLYFIGQVTSVSKGFWIGFTFPDTIFEVTGFQFTGNNNYYITIGFILVFYIYLIVKGIRLRKQKHEMLPAGMSILVYILVILAAIAVTICAKTSILLYRYLFVVTGLYIFAISYVLAKENKKWLIAIFCIATLVSCGFSTYEYVKDNYDKHNNDPMNYLRENIQESDVFVSESVSVLPNIVLEFPNNKATFYNEANWGVEEAYKAYAPTMDVQVTKNFLRNINGRVWIVDDYNETTYKKLFEGNGYHIVSKQTYKIAYHDLDYVFILVEKTQN